MKILIKVTKEILSKSMMCGTKQCNGSNSTHCAIALAVRDIFPKAIVVHDEIYPFINQRDNHLHDIELPSKAIKFIQMFDALCDTPIQRLDMPELEFKINVPESIIQEIGIGQVYKILSESKTLELVNL